MTSDAKNEISEMLSTLLDPDDPAPTEATHEPSTTQGFTPGVLVPGDQIHFRVATSLLTHESPSMLGGGVLVERGATVTVTQAILDENKDRNGNSWLEMVDDPERQIRAFGVQRFGRGAFPKHLSRFLPGSPEEIDERNRRRAAASKLPDAEAAAERARIRAELGTGGNSVTLANLYGGR